MRWELVFYSWEPTKRPMRGLTVKLHARWHGDEGAELFALDWFAGAFETVVLWPSRVQVVLDGYRDAGESQSSVWISLHMPLDATSIGLINERRAQSGATAGVPITIWATPYYRPMIAWTPAGIDKQSADRGTGRPRRCLVGAGTFQGQERVDVRLSGDDWRAALAGVGWDELEVFEVSVRHIADRPDFAKAIESLRRARDHFRGGAWDACAMEAGKAIEHIGGAYTDDKKPHKKRAAIADAVAPGDEQTPFRDAVASLLHGIAELRNPGAHPSAGVQRAEAELALTVAISTLRYLGERLAGRAS